MVCYSHHMATETLTEEIAQRVAAAITQADRSKNWVAGKSGIAETTFTRKVNGHGDFTVPELARIASALDIPASRLLPEFLRRSGGDQQ